MSISHTIWYQKGKEKQMRREELRRKIEKLISSGHSKNKIELIDVLYYKTGGAQKVVVVELKMYGALSSSIRVHSSDSAEKALLSAIDRHTNGGELDMSNSVTGKSSDNTALVEEL